MQRNGKDWGSLPVELLHVMARTFEASDEFSAAAVCRHWRRALLHTRGDAWRKLMSSRCMLGGWLGARGPLLPDAMLQHLLLLRLLAVAQPQAFEGELEPSPRMAREIRYIAEQPFSDFTSVVLSAEMGAEGMHVLRVVSLGAPGGPAPGAWLTWHARVQGPFDEPQITLLGVDGSTSGALHPVVSANGRMRFATEPTPDAVLSEYTPAWLVQKLVMAFGAMLAIPAHECGESVPPEVAAAHAAAHCQLSLAEVVANGGWRRRGSVLPLPTDVAVLAANAEHPRAARLFDASARALPQRPSWEKAVDLQLLLMLLEGRADSGRGASVALAIVAAARAAGVSSLARWIGLL